jgi:hypothetical protein
MNAYNTLYEGVDGLAKAVRVIVNQGQNAAAGATAGMNKQTDEGSGPLGHYMRLALSIDLSLSSGKLPQDRDFPERVQEHLSSSPESLEQVPLEPAAPLMQAGEGEWMMPDESVMASGANDPRGDLWDLEGLSPRAAEYRILESMIWSSPSPGVF